MKKVLIMLFVACGLVSTNASAFLFGAGIGAATQTSAGSVSTAAGAAAGNGAYIGGGSAQGAVVGGSFSSVGLVAPLGITFANGGAVATGANNLTFGASVGNALVGSGSAGTASGSTISGGGAFLVLP